MAQVDDFDDLSDTATDDDAAADALLEDMRRLNREVNDGQPNHQHVIENGKDTVAVDNTSAPRKGRSRKAANLAELQRYFTAAADAAAMAAVPLRFRCCSAAAAAAPWLWHGLVD